MNIKKLIFMVFITGSLLGILYYLSLSLLVISIIPPANNDSFLYLLSSLAQTQITIFAIAIGLNSIILQLISSNYSSRLSYIFSQNSKHIWWFIGFSILLDFILILILPEKLTPLINFAVVGALVLAIFIYCYAIWHICKTISFLDPQRILNTILEGNTSKNNTNEKKEQIFDLMSGLINRHNQFSVSICLKKLVEIYSSELFYTPNSKGPGSSPNSQVQKFDQIVLELIRVGKISAKLEGDDITSDIISTIHQVFDAYSKKTSNENLVSVCSASVVENIKEFVIYCMKYDLENSAISGMDLLVEIFKNIHTAPPSRANLLDSIIKISLVASTGNLERLLQASINNIEQLLNVFYNNRYGINQISILNIGQIGIASANNRLEGPTEKILIIMSSFLFYISKEKGYLISNENIDSIDYAFKIIYKINVICLDNLFVNSVKIINQLKTNLNLTDENNYYCF